MISTLVGLVFVLAQKYDGLDTGTAPLFLL